MMEKALLLKQKVYRVALTKELGSGVAAKGQQVAHTLGGQLDQARQWLLHPERNDNGLGQRAISLIIDEAHRVK
jgi:vinculin